MSTHDYTASQALELLMRKLREADASLADRVQAAIDAGQDVSQTEPSQDRRKKARTYRKQVPFSPEDALQEALNSLQAYFVEQPLFENAALDSFASSALGDSPKVDVFGKPVGDKEEPTIVDAAGKEKRIEIALLRETRIFRSSEDRLALQRHPKDEIEVQRKNIERLRSLMRFMED